jgi:dipeptidyl aminopeptidase/acylaminoacyl peptidase
MERPEVTVAMCTSGRELAEPQPSPDGELVAFTARWGAESAVVVVPTRGGAERIVTSETPPAVARGLGGGCFAWLPHGDGIVYVSGDGAIWSQHLAEPAARRVAFHEGRDVRAPNVSPDGAHVVYAVDHAEIWVAPLDGSAPQRRLDDGSADFCADPVVDVARGRVVWQAWNVPDMPWDGARLVWCSWPDDPVAGDEARVERRGELRGSGAIQQPRPSPDGDLLCVRDDTGWLNVWRAGAPLVEEPFEHAGPSWGMGQRSFAMSPDGRRVAFTRNESGFGRLCVLDVASGAVTEVGRGVHGQLAWCGDVVTAVRTGARTPTRIVAYDPATWSRRTLAVGPVMAWDAADLPEPELVEVDHDDVTLHARRYRAGAGRTLVWVHGGPTDQWQVEFLPRVAYWWAHGFDVLVPDPRGTTGHGRSYQQALHGEWGRLDVDDTAAIVRDAFTRGDSSPDRTIAVGGSSGGLTVLGLLGRHDGLAAGGIVSYPVTDLADLAARSHRFEAHYTLTLVGPPEDVQRYHERSPLSYADRVRVPLLVMHGDADPVVPLDQSVRLAERVRDAGGDVALHVFPGEGHGFRNPEHRRAEYELMHAFVDRVLGT